MTGSNGGEYICKSGAIFIWTQQDGPHAGVLSGAFRASAPAPTEADIDEAKAFIRTMVPEGNESVFERVLRGPEMETRQRAVSITDQLLGRASRN